MNTFAQTYRNVKRRPIINSSMLW